MPQPPKPYDQLKAPTNIGIREFEGSARPAPDPKPKSKPKRRRWKFR